MLRTLKIALWAGVNHTLYLPPRHAIVERWGSESEVCSLEQGYFAQRAAGHFTDSFIQRLAMRDSGCRFALHLQYARGLCCCRCCCRFSTFLRGSGPCWWRRGRICCFGALLGATNELFLLFILFSLKFVLFLLFVLIFVFFVIAILVAVETDRSLSAWRGFCCI